MKESFLHYIWQYQYFNKSELKTEDGEDLNILFPGKYNLESGPDFHFGKIMLGSRQWIGQIEIHINSSDWYAHKHQFDPAYEQVILHVVWKHNREVHRMDGSLIPVLELSSRVDPDLRDRTMEFLSSLNRLPCINHLDSLNRKRIKAMIAKAFERRMLRKAIEYENIWFSAQQDWQECFYRVFLRAFGFGLNTTAFDRLGQLIPFRLLRRLIHDPFSLESILFGQSGLLSSARGTYAQDLRQEYSYLSYKFNLKEPISLHEWKFSRMRPSNFPALRIAQFAGIIHRRPGIFNDFEGSDLKELYKILKAKPSDYWKNHYMFGKTTGQKTPALGKDSMNSLLINTIVPMLLFKGEYKNVNSLTAKAKALIHSIPAEKNRVTRMWTHAGIDSSNAFETQGLYALYQHFCKPRKCLQCDVGTGILSK